MRTRRNRDWDDDNLDPLKGPKGDTAFLKDNYRLMGPGGVFRTVKARFSPKKIHAEALKAGWTVDIQEEGLWLRVQIVGKAKS
jgi:hypothetical protein